MKIHRNLDKVHIFSIYRPYICTYIYIPSRVTITRIRDKFEVLLLRFKSHSIKVDRTKRKCYGVPASISRFNPSRLLPLGNFKVHGVRHKTTNTGGTAKSDKIRHQ